MGRRSGTFIAEQKLINYKRNKMKNTLLSLISILFAVNSYSQIDTLNAPKAVLPNVYADPHIAVFEKKFYIYPTTDGSEGWKSTNFTCWSSKDLVKWKYE